MDPYATELARLGAEHQSILDMANQVGIHAAGNGETDLPRFEALVNYLTQHLRHEEGVMRVLRFPGREAHLEEHLQLQRYFTEVIRPMLMDPARVAEAVDLLKARVVEHVLNEDQTFINFVQLKEDLS